MVRASFLVLFLAVAFAFSSTTVRADVISRDNPYRNLNLTGMNYSSLRWEQQHHRTQKHVTTRPTRLIRARAR